MSDPRRFLIATAVSHYPHAPEWDRPGLVEARRKMVELFTGRLGYEHVSDLGTNPTQHQLLRELREFCRSPDRRPDDVVAVYIAGHGERLDNEEYVLLTSDTNPDDLYDALQPGTLARKILAGTKVRRLLLMLDTCYSGQGGNELLSSMAKLKGNWRGKDAGLAVITSAQPNELARTGAFPDLLSEAVTSLATAGYTPQLLSLDAVVNATRANPKRPDFQHIGLEIIGLTGEIPPFLPNAKHSPRLSHTDMALQQAEEWREQDQQRDVEFRTRLLRRAMGHRDETLVGWWFSGRHRALEDITGWLNDLPDERPALVVTADPGSGKTAVLGLLATMSDPEHRRTVPVASLGLSDGQLPPPKAIGTAVYAQSLTDQQVVRALSAALRLPPTEAVADLLNHLNSLSEPDRPHVVLIDGVDEAATPTTLCGQVLRPVMELAGPHLRLLLGTRPHLLDPLGLDRRDQVDLDAARYADPDAVLAYTLRNLIDAHPESPYLGCSHDDRLAVAEAVAAAAGRSFLVARITAGTLAATPELPAPEDPGWRLSLPSAAADAMRNDLHQRFGEGARRILDLLRPLAYAEGQGLPWEDVWAPLASLLSGHRYTNEDLHRLRRDAGAYVVEAAEDGRSVYRLYHEAMAEYLRQGQDTEAAHRAFTTTLRRAVPYGLDGTPDWARAHPYALRHLATHASAAGLIDTLLTDLAYLVHADCDGLAPHLLKAESDTARLHAAIYLNSLHVHRGIDVTSRRRLLAVDAARFNEPATLEALNSRAPEQAWKPVAASGFQVSANLLHVCAAHTQGVTAVACTELNGRPVAVSASQDDTLRIWDLTTGRPVGEPLIGHTSSVDALACTTVDGRPVVVSGSSDNTVRVWDLATGRPAGAPLTGHISSVDKLLCTELDGRPIALSGARSDGVRIWDLATGQPVGEPMTDMDLLGCAVAGDRAVVVTSSRSELTVWDLKTRTQLGQLEAVPHFECEVLACTELDDHPVAVALTRKGVGYIWDLNTHRVVARLQYSSGRPKTLAFTELDGHRVAVVGFAGDAMVRIFALTHHQHVVPLLNGQSSDVRGVTCSSLSGQPVAVTGSGDGTVRVWSLSPRQVVGKPVVAHTDTVTDVQLAVVNGRPAFVTASADKTVRLWDRSTCRPLGPHIDPVVDLKAPEVSCAVLGVRPVAVSLSKFNQRVKVWDLETGRLMHSSTQLVHFPFGIVACTVVNDRPIAIANSEQNTLLVWDLITGKELYKPLETDTGQIIRLSCVDLDGRPIAVTSSFDDTLCVWDLATGRPLGVGLPTGWGPTAFTVLDGRVVAVSSDGNTMHVLDIRTGQSVGDPMAGHTHDVSALVCAQLDGRPVAVAGAHDNTVRIWDLRTGALIDVIHVPGPCGALALDETGLLICSFGSDVGVFRRH
ncbi:caspase family protein [Streptomyces sp. NPDC005374]|uniref:caspase family protein n=1 Tax=Streptomyces sp. NPDC005374 TaxID=3364713 RepID=UPI0036BBE243